MPKLFRPPSFAAITRNLVPFMKLPFFMNSSLLILIGLNAAHIQALPASPKAAQTVASVQASLCPAADQLISLIGSRAIYAQTPEEFFKSSAGLIKPTQDKTSSAYVTRREIAYGAAEGNWLVGGNASYAVGEKYTKLEETVFNFLPSCFRSPDDFIRQAKEKIGKGYRHTPAPAPNDGIKEFFWDWKDSDINFVRTMQVTVAGVRYEIKIKIDPAPEEGD